MTLNEMEMLHEIAAFIKALTGAIADGVSIRRAADILKPISSKIEALDDVVRGEAETAELIEQYRYDHNEQD